MNRFLDKRLSNSKALDEVYPNSVNKSCGEHISLLLENINENYDYSKIEGIDNIYVPLKFLVNKI